jgi:hypothetical protein
MKKKKYMKIAMLSLIGCLVLTFLSACAESIPPSNPLQSQNTADFEQEETPNVESTLAPDDLEGSEEIQNPKYILTQKKDGMTYTVTVMEDSDSNYTILLFDSKSNLLQTIAVESYLFIELDFQDVNLDGYTDIIANTGGTLNETHVLYIWNAPSQSFLEVAFCGFDMLSYFEVYDGYLMNWVKDTASSGFIQKLIWNENSLVLESEESYDLEE